MKKFNITFILTIIALQWVQPVLGQDDKPNFLFILTDDQTYETIHALNNTQIITPNMDRLVNEGVTFTHTFNQGSWSPAICVASRSMLITGQNVFKAVRNEAYLDEGHHFKGNTIKTEVPLWQEVFEKNGYNTFITGKWHNSDYALKGFDKGHSVLKTIREYQNKRGINPIYYRKKARPAKWNPWDKKYKGHWSVIARDIVRDEDGENKVCADFELINKHSSELFSDHAIDYLMNYDLTEEKPFFMYVAFFAPHDPRQSPKEYVDMYPVDSIKIPENYLDKHPFNQGDNRIRDENLGPHPRTKESVQLHRSEYYAIITHLDHELGRIMTALEKRGLDENTYVILSADHGLAVGQHGLMGKQNQYDHTVRMPLIIKGPGLEAGRKINNKVYLQSMFATTCELASIEVPETIDFKSLKGLIDGDKLGGEEYIFGAYRNLQRMIRSDKYKLIVYPEVKKIQLFDLENDPHEITDLSDNQKYTQIKKKLFEELLKKQKELGDYITLNETDY
ncbi:sulfatase-like hydrolase/transferase [Bacteroidota bacterium]